MKKPKVELREAQSGRLIASLNNVAIPGVVSVEYARSTRGAPLVTITMIADLYHKGEAPPPELVSARWEMDGGYYETIVAAD